MEGGGVTKVEVQLEMEGWVGDWTDEVGGGSLNVTPMSHQRHNLCLSELFLGFSEFDLETQE